MMLSDSFLYQKQLEVLQNGHKMTSYQKVPMGIWGPHMPETQFSMQQNKLHTGEDEGKQERLS